MEPGLGTTRQYLCGNGSGLDPAGWRPTWRFHFATSLRVTTYGLNIVILEIIGAFRNNVDYLLVGRILGAAALGYYTMSYRIPSC